MRIKSTSWARKFKRECPLQYDEAIYYASQHECRVAIIYSNELDPDVMEYAIVVEGTEFWLDAFTTREEAVKLCNKMNWRIINESLSNRS